MTSAIVLTIFVAVLLYGIVIYNGLVALKHAVSKAWANIDVLLKQRHDELPKLIETCKQYMQFEKETLERVMAARTAGNAAREKGDVKDHGRQHRVGQGGPRVALGKSPQRRQVAKDAARLVKCAHRSIYRRQLDRHVSAGRTVHLGQQRGRDLNEWSAAQIGGGDESREIADDSTA